MDDFAQRAVVLSQSPYVIVLLTIFGLLAGLEFTLRYTVLSIKLFSRYLYLMKRFSKHAVIKVLQMNLRQIRTERFLQRNYPLTIGKAGMGPIGIMLILGFMFISLSIWESKIDFQFYLFLVVLIPLSMFYIYGRYMFWFTAFAKKDTDAARDFALSALRKIKQ